MTGRVNRLEAPFRPSDRITITNHHVGDEIPVAALLATGLAASASGMRTETVCRRSGSRLDRLRRRRMVAVGMRNKDVRHALLGEASKQRTDMVFEIGAGIDNRDVALTNHVG